MPLLFILNNKKIFKIMQSYNLIQKKINKSIYMISIKKINDSKLLQVITDQISTSTRVKKNIYHLNKLK